ncbi:MAG: hypothetical protein QM813_11610 [Verrucomicrobiota bacterium]
MPGIFTFSRTGATDEPLRVYYGVEGETVRAYKNGQPVITYRGLPGYVDIPDGLSSVAALVSPVSPPPGGMTVTVTIRPEGDYSIGKGKTASVQIK